MKTGQHKSGDATFYSPFFIHHIVQNMHYDCRRAMELFLTLWLLSTYLGDVCDLISITPELQQIEQSPDYITRLQNISDNININVEKYSILSTTLH